VPALHRWQPGSCCHVPICLPCSHSLPQVSTLHYDVVPLEDGALQGHSTTPDSPRWQLYLVQEVCTANLAHALSSNVLHDPNSRQPNMVGLQQHYAPMLHPLTCLLCELGAQILMPIEVYLPTRTSHFKPHNTHMIRCASPLRT
jgi:hypothetical protein